MEIYKIQLECHDENFYLEVNTDQLNLLHYLIEQVAECYDWNFNIFIEESFKEIPQYYI